MGSCTFRAPNLAPRSSWHEHCDGRARLVTGGAAGIGQAIAARCRADGLHPVVVDREGGDGVIRADLADPEDTARALREALRTGSITRLVNNVGRAARPRRGANGRGPDAVVSLNLRCALQCLQALLPGMKEEDFGRVVDVSSRAAIGKELRTVFAATNTMYGHRVIAAGA
jgi:3-oxoacyl-[acyl-carrier protein] reductase